MEQLSVKAYTRNVGFDLIQRNDRTGVGTFHSKIFECTYRKTKAACYNSSQEAYETCVQSTWNLLLMSTFNPIPII